MLNYRIDRIYLKMHILTGWHTWGDVYSTTLEVLVFLSCNQNLLTSTKLDQKCNFFRLTSFNLTIVLHTHYFIQEINVVKFDVLSTNCQIIKLKPSSINNLYGIRRCIQVRIYVCLFPVLGFLSWSFLETAITVYMCLVWCNNHLLRLVHNMT